MKMNTEGSTVVLSAAMVLAAAGSSAQDPAMKKAYEKHFGKPVQHKAPADAPNILLITSDQHHWMFMGYNDPTLKTPNLDRLAAMGTIFDRAYTPNPVSTPTRASIITGMYPSQHGAYALGTKLDERVPVVGDDLARGGYRTALVGKAHFQPLTGTPEYPSAEAYPMLHDYAFWRKFHGPFYGFEYVEMTRNHGDEAHVGQHYAIWLQERVGEQWKEWFMEPTGTTKRQYGAWPMPEQYHMNAWIAERTNVLIDKYTSKNEKFFIWASFFDPHPPYLLPEPWASMYRPEDMTVPENAGQDLADMPLHYRVAKQQGKIDRSKWIDQSEPFNVRGIGAHKIKEDAVKANMTYYYGMITFMDHYIGKILDKLEEKGLLENTLIVFTTDHGHLLGQHGLVSKGVFDYEDAVKIPFTAAYKGHIPAGRRTGSMQSLIDLAPTFLSYAGLPLPHYMSGVDQKEVWNGQKDKARDFVIVENRFQPTKFYVRTYIDERYKICYDMNSDEGELFDLQADPSEMRNLWNVPEYKELKTQLLLRALQADMKSEPGMPRVAAA